MDERPLHVFLARHGETEWSLNGRHTGRQDIPLTSAGEDAARKLGARLRRRSFAAVFTSPLERAKRTCELCGFAPIARVLPDLMEWDYGDYEGLRSAEIHARRQDWRLFRDGCPGGESPQDVAARADRVLPRLKGAGGDVLVFSHGHFLRMLMSRWISLASEQAARFSLDAASLSILSLDPHSGDPVLERWNDIAHLDP
ncbi:MAG TPA: histidine phosphatase family protein [Planctomycetota bacterium]|nr:histidine phosphatase family protein [Planctomycetota bacterium]